MAKSLEGNRLLFCFVLSILWTNSVHFITQPADICNKQAVEQLVVISHSPKARFKCLDAEGWVPMACYGTHIDNKNVHQGLPGKILQVPKQKEFSVRLSWVTLLELVSWQGWIFWFCFQSQWLLAQPCFREQGQTSNCMSSWCLRLWSNRFYFLLFL